MLVIALDKKIKPILKSDVMKILENVIDPEIGIDIVNLGFVNDVLVLNKDITVNMTLSTPGCPMVSYIVADVKEQLEKEFKGYNVEVDLDFSEPWTPKKLSKDARKKLGYKD